jgi:predicted small metal-binding protein
MEMARKMIDCRKMPSESNCSLTIAGTEDEVLAAATAHAISAHGHDDAPELRDMIRSGMEDAEPAMA